MMKEKKIKVELSGCHKISIEFCRVDIGIQLFIKTSEMRTTFVANR